MSPANSTSATYRRLFQAFAKSYVWRLLLGVLAGMMSGGAVAGALVFMPPVLRILQGQRSPDEVLSTVARDKDGLSSLRRLADILDVPLQTEDGRITIYLVVLVVGVMLVFFLFQAISQYVNRYTLRWVGARVVTDIRTRLFRHLQDQGLVFYGREDVGKLISRCTYDTSTIEHAFAHTFADLVQAPMEVLAPMVVVIVLTTGNGLVGMMLLVLLCFPLCVLPIIYMSRRLKHYSVRALGEVSVLVSRMQETFTGIRVVKAFNMERFESERFDAESETYFRTVIRALRVEMLMTPLMQFAAIAIASMFVVLCYLRNVEFAILGTVGVAAIQAYKPIKLLAKINVQLQRCAAAADRIFELLDTDTRLPESPNPVVLTGIADRMVFEKVGFFYEQAGLRILEDIDFAIPRGSVIAFVGETGSGKSTIANLVARFYDPTEGRITLDGHDLRDVDMASLRRLIGVVTQETILFNDTIGNNIRYGRPGATMEEVIEAAKQANAHDFIMREKEGYDKVVGEKGCKVSGGERQRLAIARAILKNPPILILDEATSALDTATEQLVQEAINHVMADRTVFAIAHRLSTIRHANQILVLDKGRVIERGTHDELLARGGRYRKLCEMQFS